jgi:hypothetical protein
MYISPVLAADNVLRHCLARIHLPATLLVRTLMALIRYVADADPQRFAPSLLSRPVAA